MRLNQKYIANRLFGLDVDWDEFISRCLDGLYKPPNYLHAKQLLLELYETRYGIYDHTTTQNPLSGVLFHDSEKYLDDYLYDNYLTTYIYKQVYARTGLSFDAFLDKPRYEIEKILLIVDKYNRKRPEVASGILSDLEGMDSA